jgi:hypothetical protein
MNLNEFLNYKEHCPICSKRLFLYMEGMMTEEINTIPVNTVCLYGDAIRRKKYLTFAASDFALLSTMKDIDHQAFNTRKYSEFTLYDNNVVEFDQEFIFKFRITLSLICQSKHYSYSSRSIKISNTSPEITKGYQQVLEEASSNKYSILSDRKKKQTAIFSKDTDEPIVMPFKEVSKFPINNITKFNNKIQNMIILA